MTKPIMRFGEGEKGQKTVVDFSHLESNPNYKPEGNEEAAAQAAAETEAKAQADAEEARVAAEAQENRTPQEIAQEQAAQAQAAAQAALEGKPDTTTQFELTEDILFNALSEKLGKEIKSYDDLQTKPVEIDPRVKEMSEWAKDTGRPIEDFFKFQKDYEGVEDKVIAREYLQLKYPTFTEQEIAFKMQSMLPSEDDLEDDLMRKNIELKTFASEGRGHLNSLRKELGTPVANLMTDEVKEKVSYYDQIKSQIDAGKAQEKAYIEGLANAASASGKVKLNLAKDLAIDYSITEDERKSIPEFINSMPHWKNEDGSWNHESVVQDAYKIKHFEKLVQLAYEQGINAGTSDIVKKQNNITLGTQTGKGSIQDTGKNKPIIENIDKILNKQKMGMRGFGK